MFQIGVTQGHPTPSSEGLKTSPLGLISPLRNRVSLRAKGRSHKHTLDKARKSNVKFHNSAICQVANGTWQPLPESSRCLRGPARRDTSCKVARPTRDSSRAITETLTSDLVPVVDLDFEEVEGEEPPGSVLGAVTLITGCTIGAGILALPATTAPAGFGPSTSVLLGCWAVLLCQALLIAEVNIAVMRERDEYRLEHGRPHSPISVTLAEMAGRTIGPVGAQGVSVAYVCISMTLMVAYMAKAGEVLGALGGLQPGQGSLAFAAAAGLTLFYGGTRAADMINRYLTFAMVGLFGVVLVVGSQQGEVANLGYEDWGAAGGCVPVMFLALVYHDLIPVLVSYLGGSLEKTRRAILLGSFPPLAMFISWDAMALSIDSTHAAGVDPLAVLGATGGAWLGAAVYGFSGAAICTSFIGTALALSDFANTELQRITDKVTDEVVVDPGLYKWWQQSGMKATTLALILGPAVGVAAANPNAFLTAAHAAGAYGMTTLYGILPPIMAWKMRGAIADRAAAAPEDEPRAPAVPSFGAWKESLYQVPQLVPGGRPVLVGMGLATLSVQVSRLQADLGELSWDGAPAQIGEMGTAVVSMLATAGVP